MTLFKVTWVIDIDAPNPRAAAGKARQIQLNPENIATCFSVQKARQSRPFKLEKAVLIDLSPEDAI